MGATEYTLYTVLDRDDEDTRIQIELINTDTDDGTPQLVEMVSGGVRVRSLPLPAPPQFITDDELLILSLSDRQMGEIRRLKESFSLQRRFDRTLHLAHGPPTMIPNLSLGLESVDLIVWDDADPTGLTEAQLTALVQWVEKGGRLFLAAGRTADTLSQSARLDPLLPVTIGQVSAHKRLPDVRRRLLLAGDRAVTGAPVTVAACTLREGPEVQERLRDEVAGTFLASRRVGMGEVVFIAASLNELLTGPNVQVEQALIRLLGLRDNPIPDADIDAAPYALFRHIEAEIGFLGAGSAYLALALLFAAIYTLSSTLGAWNLLGRRNLRRHSWTVLAIAGLIASLVMILAVQAVHGYSRRVHQVTVIDGTAGKSDAVATAWFGLTTPTVTRLDLWLPGDLDLHREPEATACMLRPLPGWNTALGINTGFTDPAQYRLRPPTAELHDVPMRATLKQVEGRWVGALDGTIRGELITAVEPLEVPDEATEDAYGYVLAAGSWLENGLDVDLRDCVLFVAEEDLVRPQDFLRLASQRAQTDDIIVYPIGDLPKDSRVDLRQRILPDKNARQVSVANLDKWSLKQMQRTWDREFLGSVSFGGRPDNRPLTSTLEAYKHSILLATVISEITPREGASAFGGMAMHSRTRLRALDRSDALGRHAALLVGFAEEPGPVRLTVRTGDRPYEAMDVRKARTVYRFVVPVKAPVRK